MRPNFVLQPGLTLGILGGGQLGRMLALAAAPLGFHVHIYSPENNSPAVEVASKHTQADYDDMVALKAFAESVDIITYEFENIPAEPLEMLQENGKLFPSVKALEVTQDRFVEKEFLRGLSLPVADYCSVDSFEDFSAAVNKLGRPSILKTRRFGYDGKGQAKVMPDSDLVALYKGFDGVPSILEAFVSFECEISVVMARARNGDHVVYDISRNHHVNQILNTSTVPSGLPENVLDNARKIATIFADAIDYVGVIAVELFCCRDENGYSLVVNEIAPRVHNSGHWTLDACFTSQFENHVRAVAGWPFGSAERFCDAVMLNLIGDDVHDWQKYSEDEFTKVHLYGKSNVRSGRKMGHVTTLSIKK